MKLISGLNKKSAIRPLGTLEMEVMKVLWKKGEVTGKQAWKDINSNRKAALTTILTVIDRLSHKGFVKKTKTENLFIYTPSIKKDDYTKEISRAVLKGYMDLSSASLIASFVDTLEEFDQDGIQRLSAYIEKKRKEGSKVSE